MGRRTRVVNDDPANDGKSLATMPDDLREVYSTQTPVVQDFQTEEDEVNAILSEVGGSEGGGNVVIRKLNAQTRKLEWLDRCPIADFTGSGGVAYLAKKWGGGEYELLVYDKFNHIIKRPRVTIAASVLPEPKADASPQAGVDKLAGVMLEGFKQLAAQQAQLVQQMQRPAETKADWLREIAMMRELFGGNNQSDPLGTLAKVIPVVRDLMPRGEGETNMLDVFMRLAQEFGPAIKAAVEKTPALTAFVPPAQPGAVTQSIPPEQHGANQMQLMLKAKLALLCAKAKADADPGPYAAIICEEVSPEVLSNLVNNPDWLGELAKINPGVKLFPQWFAELREAVIEIMTEAGEGPDNENLTGTENAGIQPGTDVEDIHVPGSDD